MPARSRDRTNIDALTGKRMLNKKLKKHYSKNEGKNLSSRNVNHGNRDMSLCDDIRYVVNRKMALRLLNRGLVLPECRNGKITKTEKKTMNNIESDSMGKTKNGERDSRSHPFLVVVIR